MVSKSLHATAISHPLFGGKINATEPLVKGCKTSMKVTAFRLRPKFTARIVSKSQDKDVSRSCGVSFLLNDIQSSMKHISMDESSKRCDSDDEFADFVLDVPRGSTAKQVQSKREQPHPSFAPRPARRTILSSLNQDTRNSSTWEMMNAETGFQGSADLSTQRMDFGSCHEQTFVTPPRSSNHLRMRINESSNPFRPDVVTLSCEIATVSFDSFSKIGHAAAAYEPTTPEVLESDVWSSVSQWSRPFPARIYLPDI